MEGPWGAGAAGEDPEQPKWDVRIAMMSPVGAGTLLLAGLIMANRRNSLTQQIATAIMLGCAWWLMRDRHRRKAYMQDSPEYIIDRKRYVILSLLLFAADIYAIPAVLRGKQLIDKAELSGISAKLVHKSQHVALGYDPEKRGSYQKASDRLLGGIVGLPALLMLDERLRKDWDSLGVLYLWLHALSYTLYSFSPLGPALVDKYRPLVYYTGITEEERGRGNNRNARYSGHTGNAACATFFMAKVYSDYHTELDEAERMGLYVLAFMPPLLLGWLRTKALKHFPVDVLQAIGIGACCGVMIPELYRKSGILSTVED